ncbi:MAG TPA: NepR family anti-sigma factor [Pseudolabrys sp.]|nr:NepR family anti-sigma factor [Pseudolabrys sp.]
MEATTRSKKAPVKLSRDIQARLGQQLRAMYDDVVEQGVPERFTELLNRLDENGTKGKS